MGADGDRILVKLTGTAQSVHPIYCVNGIQFKYDLINQIANHLPAQYACKFINFLGKPL
jgi:hypothetical protein